MMGDNARCAFNDHFFAFPFPLEDGLLFFLAGISSLLSPTSSSASRALLASLSLIRVLRLGLALAVCATSDGGGVR